jgi:hypothetical protein
MHIQLLNTYISPYSFLILRCKIKSNFVAYVTWIWPPIWAEVDLSPREYGWGRMVNKLDYSRRLLFSQISKSRVALITLRPLATRKTNKESMRIFKRFREWQLFREASRELSRRLYRPRLPKEK